MMSLCLGISRLALPNSPAGTTTPQSGCSSFSSQRWNLNNARSVSLRVWPNPRGRSSGQVQEAEAGEGIFARKGLSAEFVADGREFSEEGFVPHDPVGYRGGAAGRRAAPHRSDGRFWRRFPGFPQGGNRDVTVPIEALRKGAVFRGIVSAVQPFGAFVSFGAFADGLIHISKLGTGYVKNVGDLVELEQEVMVTIVNVEESTGRISLSLMEKDQVDLRKPYVAPGLEEARRIGERPRFQSGFGRSALTVGEREERVSKGSYASSSRSMDSRKGDGWPRRQPESGRISHSMPEEEQERYSSNPNAYSRQPGGRRGGGKGPRFQSGSGWRSPFVVEEEEHISWNPFASTRLRDAGEGDIGLKNAFASPRTGHSRGEDRLSRNPFASSRQGQAGEGDGVSKNPFASPRTRQSRGEDRQSRNPFAPFRQGEAGEGDRVSKNRFASPRKGQTRGEDRQSRNPFASPRQWEAREEDRTSRNLSVPSRRREAGEEGTNTRAKYERNDDNINSRGRLSRVGNGADREEQTKPRMKLVQISDAKSEEDKVSSRMRNVMSSWYECDCCY